MSKTEAELIFDYLVAKEIWPLFKTRGYKKNGNNYKLYDSSGWGKIVNYQKSAWYDKDNIHFTVNVGLYLAETEEYHCNRQSLEKFLEHSCVVRKRICRFLPNKEDTWFEINDTTVKEDLCQTIKQHFENLILPFLDTINTKDDILKLLLDGHLSDYMPAQIITLYNNGFKEQARTQLEQQFIAAKGSEGYINWLKEVENKMID